MLVKNHRSTNRFLLNVYREHLIKFPAKHTFTVRLRQLSLLSDPVRATCNEIASEYPCMQTMHPETSSLAFHSSEEQDFLFSYKLRIENNLNSKLSYALRWARWIQVPAQNLPCLVDTTSLGYYSSIFTIPFLLIKT